MHFLTRYLLTSLLACTSSLMPTHAATPPIFGALLPPPNLPSSPSFAAVLENLTALLETSLTNDSTAGFPITTTSFSASLTSLHTRPDAPVLWDFHHLAPNRSRHSTAALSGQTPYLLASVSKVFTALLTLQDAARGSLSLDKPITDFLPELLGPGTSNSSNSNSSPGIPWSQIPLSTLLTHLSGIPQTYGFPELAALTPTFEALGFPRLRSPADFPPCGVIGLNDGCTKEGLLDALATQEVVPVVRPGTSPVYGTLSFVLLGLVLERVNGNATYAELLRQRILEPLGIRGFGVSGEEGVAGEGVAVVPVGEGSWGSEFGINTPASGLVGGSDDLSRLLRAVLRGKEALGLGGEGDVREWLKPRTFTPVEDGAVGAPWEVYRVAKGVLTTEERGQGVEVYAKDGSVLGYYSRVMLVPAFRIGVTVLTATEAGDTRGLNAVSEAVLATVVRGAEEAARLEADQKFSGEYLAEGEVDGNITLRVDEGPGLRVEGLFRNGSDILASIEGIFQQSVVGGAMLNDEWRLYPTGIVNEVDEDGKKVVLEDWRLGFEPIPAEMEGMLAEAGKGIFEGADSAWLRIDGSMVYGGRPVDRFVFVKEDDGHVRSIRLPALRIEMGKD